MEGKSVFNKGRYRYTPTLLLLSIFIILILPPFITQAAPYVSSEDGIALRYSVVDPGLTQTTPLTGENDSSELDNNLGHSPVGHGETPEPGFWEWVQNTIKDFFSGEKDEKEESSWWDRVTNGVGNFFESVGDFFGSVGEWISDIWDGLSDWTKDLIVTIGIIVAVVIGVVLVVVLLGLGFVVGLVGSLVAIIAGVTYFLLFGGTDQFNAFHAFLWTVTGAITGVVTTVAVVALQASGTLAALLNLGKIKLVELALTSRIYFWITNSLRVGIVNTVGSWFSAAGSLFLRFSTGLYLTGMRVLTAFTGWLNVARLGVLRFSTNMYVVFNNLLIRFNSFVLRAGSSVLNWARMTAWPFLRNVAWPWIKPLLKNFTWGFLGNLIYLVSVGEIQINDWKSINKAVVDSVFTGLFSALTFRFAAAFRGATWQKKLRYTFYASIFGGIINLANHYYKTGELDLGAFTIGWIIVTITFPIINYWISDLIPDIAKEFTTKGASDFIENRFNDFRYWNNPDKHPDNKTKETLTRIMGRINSRIYEIQYRLYELENIFYDFIYRNMR